MVDLKRNTAAVCSLTSLIAGFHGTSNVFNLVIYCHMASTLKTDDKTDVWTRAGSKIQERNQLKYQKCVD